MCHLRRRLEFQEQGLRSSLIANSHMRDPRHPNSRGGESHLMLPPPSQWRMTQPSSHCPLTAARGYASAIESTTVSRYVRVPLTPRKGGGPCSLPGCPHLPNQLCIHWTSHIHISLDDAHCGTRWDQLTCIVDGVESAMSSYFELELTSIERGWLKYLLQGMLTKI